MPCAVMREKRWREEPSVVLRVRSFAICPRARPCARSRIAAPRLPFADRLEQPAQRVPPKQGDCGEDPAQRQVVAKAGVQAEPWEHQDLRRNRQRVTHS